MKEYAFFNRSEETDLVNRWRKQGDQLARKKLIESQMAWAKKLAVSFARAKGWSDIDEAESAAYLGVVTGVEKFCLSRGCRLTTYTFHWVMNAVRIAYRKSQPIHVPPGAHARPSTALAAERASKVLGILESIHCHSDSDDNHPQVLDSSSEPTDHREDEIKWALAGMDDPREAEIIRRNVMDGERLIDIAASLGISKQRACQLKLRGLPRLRRRLEDMNIH